MRISKHFEEALYVLLILATQKQHQPLKNANLSALLRVSDSSLKKVMRKLVLAGFVASNASKDGGFNLVRPLKTITLADVLIAIEGKPLISMTNSHLAQIIFPQKEHVLQSETLVSNMLQEGAKSLTETLSHLTLDQLLQTGGLEGTINWQKHSTPKGHCDRIALKEEFNDGSH